MAIECPVCSSKEQTLVLELKGLPVAINAQSSPVESSAVPKGDISLVVCNRCTHLFNTSFDETLTSYDSSYENSLHFSSHFREHAKSLAKRLVHDFDLSDETVAEAGAGPGHFLELLCQEGVKNAYGFDPSYDPNRLGAPSQKGVTLSNNLFPSDGSIKAKMAMSQHVLEHLTSPVELLSILKSATQETDNSIVYSEVPNGDLMIDKCALWDLIYEHISFFTKKSLATAVGLSGLSVHSTGADFGDQFLWTISKPGETLPVPVIDESTESAIDRTVKFGEKAREQIEAAKLELQQYQRQGPVVLWGAGSKGMTYLNLIATNQQVSTVVDVNPRKTGFGVPGTDYVITTPESLVTLKPKTVLIANPVYKAEIESILTSNGITCNVTPLWV